MTRIEDLLIFPEGKVRGDVLRSDGIWDFISVSSGNDISHLEAKTAQYQGKYQSVTEAESYNVAYKQRKSGRTKKEIAIINRLLAGISDVETLLDIPCGGGRLSPAMAKFSRALIEMDLSLGQIQYGLEYGKVSIPQFWIRASGFQIPLKENSIDGAVCIRLSHHLYSLSEKEKLLAELIRVSKRFVVFSFVDSESIKYSIRKWKSAIMGTPLKSNSTSVAEVKDIVQKYGGKLAKWPAIGLFQAHRYALISLNKG